MRCLRCIRRREDILLLLLLCKRIQLQTTSCASDRIPARRRRAGRVRMCTLYLCLSSNKLIIIVNIIHIGIANVHR